MTLPNYFQTNTIYCGDCKDILRKFPEKSVDLIYADPPFFSNQQYEVIWGDGFEIRAFEDRWKGGIPNYIMWMQDRLMECHRVLKDTGTMYLHCDFHAGHYLKVEMDRHIFSEQNFRCEIVWQKIRVKKGQSEHFPKVHDTILVYSKSDKFTFYPQFRPLDEKYVKSHFSQVDKKGRHYRLVSFIQGGQGPKRRFGEKWIEPPVAKHWIWGQERIDEAWKKGRLVILKSGRPYLVNYLDESKGNQVGDIWMDIPPINAVANERLGYPTQKPEALLNRIISASSDPTNIVLDPFCGCGTAIVVAHKLGRRWIGIDVSPTACNLMQKRLRKLHVSAGMMGMPLTEDDLRKLQSFDFQNWVVHRLYGKVSAKKSSDMGIDGYTFEGFPIQVKQSDSIGRNVVDNFETAMRRRNAKKGVIVAFSFGHGSYDEIARVKLEEEMEIIAITVKDLIEDRKTQAKSDSTQTIF